MKKVLYLTLIGFLLQNICFANDVLKFDFPNQGWHKTASPDGTESKKCYAPAGQTAENYTEMLTFMQKSVKNKNIPPIVILQKQLGKDKTNYTDIYPEYITQDFDNAMAVWCSKSNNTCVMERAFKGNDGVILVIYTNKAPHYSQNMFGQWSNILSKASVYNVSDAPVNSSGLIEL